MLSPRFRGKIFTTGRTVAFVGCATSERTQATMTVRSAMTALNFGVEKYFVYEFQSPETSRTNPESHFGLLHKDYTPKPAFHAYKTLIGLWPEGSKRIETAKWSNCGLYRVAWRRPDGSRVTALWTDGGVRRIPADQLAGSECRDMFGKLANVTDNGLEVGGEPVYVVADL